MQGCITAREAKTLADSKLHFGAQMARLSDIISNDASKGLHASSVAIDIQMISEVQTELKRLGFVAEIDNLSQECTDLMTLHIEW